MHRAADCIEFAQVFERIFSYHAELHRSLLSAGFEQSGAGFELSTVDYVSNTKLDDLTPAAQDKVRSGIPAESQAEARDQLQTLLDPNGKNVLPYCPTRAATTPVPTTAPPPSPGASAAPAPTTTSPTIEPAQPTGPPDCRPAIR